MRVGFRTGVVDDESRCNWADTGPRPISWAAWYPVDDHAAETDLVAGGPAGSWFAIGGVAKDAPVRESAKPWPMVVISHGTGGTALSMGWLGRRLAQFGFVAVTANHHGNTAGEPYVPEGFLCWWERARDLSALLDCIPEDRSFAGRLDARRASLAGFSLGGYTAAALLGAVTDMEQFKVWAGDERLAQGPREFPDLTDRVPTLMKTSEVFRASWSRHSDSYRDDRIAAALILAPAPTVRAFTDDSLKQIATPVRIMVGGLDREAPAEVGATWLAERLPGATLDRLGPDVGHFVFLPEATDEGRRSAPHLCQDAHGVDRRQIHDAVAAAGHAIFTR